MKQPYPLSARFYRSVPSDNHPVFTPLGKIIVIILFFLLPALHSGAQNSSATWSLTSANNNLTTTGYLTATSMNRGAGVTSVGYNANGYTAKSFSETSMDAAKANHNYLQFALTPANGYTLSVSAIQFIAAVSQVGATQGARLQVQYATTADFASPISLGENVILTTTPTVIDNHNLLVPVAAGKRFI